MVPRREKDMSSLQKSSTCWGIESKTNGYGSSEKDDEWLRESECLHFCAWNQSIAVCECVGTHDGFTRWACGQWVFGQALWEEWPLCLHVTVRRLVSFFLQPFSPLSISHLLHLFGSLPLSHCHLFVWPKTPLLHTAPKINSVLKIHIQNILQLRALKTSKSLICMWSGATLHLEFRSPPLLSFTDITMLFSMFTSTSCFPPLFLMSLQAFPVYLSAAPLASLSSVC